MIHSISIITQRGHTLSIKAAGSAGPVVMLIHGFPLDHRMWLKQILPLAERFRVLVPELRGFGGSTVDADYSMVDLAEDIEQVRVHLASREQIHLVGLSMGGYVCFEYWRAFGPQLKSLVFANTKPSIDDEPTQQRRLAMAEQVLITGTWAAVAPMMERLIPASAFGTQIETDMQHMMQSASPQAVAAAQRAMANRLDFVPLLKTIKTPTLVITGQYDVIAPPEPTRAWSEQIPNAQFVELTGSGHMTTLEVPEDFNRVLLEFLNSQS